MDNIHDNEIMFTKIKTMDACLVIRSGELI